MSVIVLVDGVANGTIEIAGRDDRHHRQIHLLLVRGAGAAVKRATLFDGPADALRRRVRSDKGETIEIPLDRRGDEALLLAVSGTELVQVNSAVAEDDLGIDAALADG